MKRRTILFAALALSLLLTGCRKETLLPEPPASVSFTAEIGALTRTTLEPRLLGRHLGLHPLTALAALYAGFRLCGVAGIDRFAESPPELRPDRVRPGCKSVVVLGVRLLDGVIQAS